MGSVIAECALRLGFENICIIDGDHVETSNLNRQNYTFSDVNKLKAEAISDRLKRINPNANITYYPIFLTEQNLYDYVTRECHVAINALDFTSNVPFLFDKVCLDYNIPVLHPYNLGWAGCVFVVNKEGIHLDTFHAKSEGFEAHFASYVAKYLRHWNDRKEWLEEVLDAYAKEQERISPPQLSVASWITAGMCTNILFNLAIGREVKVFPEFYLSSIM